MSGLPPNPRVARTSYGSQEEFEEKAGRASGGGVAAESDFMMKQVGQVERAAVRFGVSVELLGRDARTANVFVCHPDDLVFDSMELSVTGHTGIFNPREELPWLARAQLIQKKGTQQIKITGKPGVQSHGVIDRDVTAIELQSRESVIEREGGFIERPYGLFLNLEIKRIVGDSALPGWASDIRFQVTVNFVSYASSAIFW